MAYIIEETHKSQWQPERNPVTHFKRGRTAGRSNSRRAAEMCIIKILKIFERKKKKQYKKRRSKCVCEVRRSDKRRPSCWVQVRALRSTALELDGISIGCRGHKSDTSSLLFTLSGLLSLSRSHHHRVHNFHISTWRAAAAAPAQNSLTDAIRRFVLPN